MTVESLLRFNGELHGEVIAVETRGVSVHHNQLADALASVGFDRSEAKAMLPRTAFSRACTKLSNKRVIRKITENEEFIMFQFTKEEQTEGEYIYDREAFIYLNKKTGTVSTEDYVLRDRVQREVDMALDRRTGSDVAKLVERLLTENGDLWHVKGGCWFLPHEFRPLVDRVHKMLSTLKFGMRRLPIPKGTEEGDQAVKDIVTSGIQKVIEEHLAAIETFSDKTRDTTIEERVKRINLTKFKVEAYASLLASQKEELLRSLRDAEDLLRKKVEEVTKPVTETVEVGAA